MILILKYSIGDGMWIPIKIFLIGRGKQYNFRVNLQIQGAPFFSGVILCVGTESEEIFQKSLYFWPFAPIFVNRNCTKIKNFPI